MASNSPSCEHPQSQPLPPTLADFTALAEKLLTTSQALLDCCKRSQELGSGAVSDSEGSSALSETSMEFRTYKIPGSAVEEEACLLKECKADCWQHVLHAIRGQFEALFLLLRHFDGDEEVDGIFLHCIVDDLMARPLNMLHTLCSVVADFAIYESNLEGCPGEA